MNRAFKSCVQLGISLCVMGHISFSQTGFWTKQYLGVSQLPVSIKSVNPAVVWLCGLSGVYNSSDGGSSWALRMPGKFRSVETINENIALVTKDEGRNTGIYRTTDFGANWTFVHRESTYINGLKMFDAINGVAIGDPKDSVWRILRTSDGGMTWNFVNDSPKQVGCDAGITNSVAIADKKFAWFGLAGCGGLKIYKSTDMGVTWKSIITPFDDSYGIAFIDSLHGAVAHGGGFQYTSDGGESWKTKGVFFPNVYKVCGTEKGELWGMGRYALFNSKDSGATWSKQYDDSILVYEDISFFSVKGRQYGWAAARGGIILKYEETPKSVIRDQSMTVNNLSLLQNYPNPFNPATTITFSLPKSENVLLKIFDALGRDIATVLNEHKSEGTHSVQFNGASIPSGIYFYRLQAGSTIITKRLSVMK